MTLDQYRVKRFSIKEQFILDNIQLAKYIYLAIIRKLPENAVIVSLNKYFEGPTTLTDQGYVYEISVYSDDYPIVENNGIDRVETLPSLTREEIIHEIELEKRNLSNNSSSYANNCICDMEYTGLKHHKRECPKYK